MSGQRTRWGWHRLDSSWAERLIDSAGIRQGDLVLEIGAGAGALTGALVHRGARVIAFELHPTRADLLRQKFATSNVVVVQADASDVRLPRRAFRVVANPPFSIGVALLRRLTSPGSRLERADIIVPSHMAERWVDGRAPGAGRWQRDFVCSIGLFIPRSAFVPPPPNSVTVLVIQRRGDRVRRNTYRSVDSDIQGRRKRDPLN